MKEDLSGSPIMCLRDFCNHSFLKKASVSGRTKFWATRCTQRSVRNNSDAFVLAELYKVVLSKVGVQLDLVHRRLDLCIG